MKAGLRGGIYGAISGGVFGGIGQAFNGTAAQGGIAHIGAHAVAGGIMEVIQGGEFAHGFLSAGVAKMVNVNSIRGIGAKYTAMRVAAAAVVGGTVSAISGGKFANGAVTAAFAQLFNGEEGAKPTDEQRENAKKTVISRKTVLLRSRHSGNGEAELTNQGVDITEYPLLDNEERTTGLVPTCCVLTQSDTRWELGDVRLGGVGLVNSDGTITSSYRGVLTIETVNTYGPGLACPVSSCNPIHVKTTVTSDPAIFKYLINRGWGD